MTNLKIHELMSTYGILYSIVANLENSMAESFGDITNLQCNDLVEQLFGSVEKIKALDNSLEGQTVPQSWKQGKVKCIVCKPKSNILIGLFYNEERPIMESIKFTKEINQIIMKSWKS